MQWRKLWESSGQQVKAPLSNKSLQMFYNLINNNNNLHLHQTFKPLVSAGGNYAAIHIRIIILKWKSLQV